jgi:hypothetical protein
MNIETANLMSPSQFNTSVGLVSLESNTQLKSNSDQAGFWRRCHRRKKDSRVWRVRGGVPASHMNRHKNENAGNKENTNQTLERNNHEN